jgi:hypothetical protein
MAVLNQGYPHEPYRNDDCTRLYPQLNQAHFCLLSKPAAPDVLMLGDSHGNMYYKAMAALAPGKSVMNLGATNCLPFAAHGSPACGQGKRLVLDFIAATPSIKTIYLAGYWDFLAVGAFKSGDFNMREVGALSPGDARLFQQDGASFLASLAATGRKLVLMRDIPDLDFNIRSCFVTRPLRLHAGTREICAMDQASYERRTQAYATALAEVIRQFPALSIYDPKPLFCDGARCWGARNGEVLYYSSDHLTLQGADLVVRDLLARYPVD